LECKDSAKTNYTALDEMQENGEPCITECAQGEIQCLHENENPLPLKCILETEVAEKRCNGVNDCGTVGANDEMQENGEACITECAQGEIQCLHENENPLPLKCIPKEEVVEKRCNGVNDCGTVGANDEMQENGEACPTPLPASPKPIATSPRPIQASPNPFPVTTQPTASRPVTPQLHFGFQPIQTVTGQPAQRPTQFSHKQQRPPQAFQFNPKYPTIPRRRYRIDDESNILNTLVSWKLNEIESKGKNFFFYFKY
jgi:hypothetical protein